MSNISRPKDLRGVHDFCQKFCETPELRELVLGTSRFLLDLCGALQLPADVAATSLLFLQQFLSNFDVFGLERPLICGACVLLGWKYWEDFAEIRSVRKLNEICRQIFKLLLFPIEDSESENDSENEEQRSGVTSGGDGQRIKENGLASMPSDEQKMFLDQQPPDPPAVPNWRKQLQPLSASAWTLRDEGREFNRMKDRIKLFESALLRCIDFEVGPILLPFDEVEALARTVWLAETSNTPEVPAPTPEVPASAPEVLAPAPEVPPHSSPASDSSPLAEQMSPPPVANSAEDAAVSPFGFIDPREVPMPTEIPNPSALDSSIAVPTSHITPVPTPVLTPVKSPVLTPAPMSSDADQSHSRAKRLKPSPSDSPHISNNDEPSHPINPINESNFFNIRYSDDQRLDDLLELSRGVVLDFYRSPFCLLSNPNVIGVAAVWKASVALGFNSILNSESLID